MRLAVDLHIHTALSPCADDDMTPANIVHMASLKGLDAIAVTDHNACFNLPAVQHFAQEEGLIFLPGIEVTTAEEVHVLLYFDRLQNALDFGEMIYQSLPDIPNNEKFFGQQLIFDESDQIIGKAPKLLSQAAPFSINQLKQKADAFGAVFIPAHINRRANSLINNLGFIPGDLSLATVEVRRGMPLPEEAECYLMISSSDAHSLEWILERTEFLEAEQKSVAGILRALSAGKQP